jgi:hypothetical protein
MVNVPASSHSSSPIMTISNLGILAIYARLFMLLDSLIS